jgi:outer membrane receptor for ferrienterochelin and colicins
MNSSESTFQPCKPQCFTISVVFALLLLSFGFPASLSAQSQMDLKELFSLSLEELMNVSVTSATRNIENINTAPATIYAISEKQIEEKGYQNLLDLLQDQPGWDFDLPQGGWVGQVAYLRGTRSNTIPILIDGVSQNSINEGEMPLYHTIPLDNIKQVEIITGPASALYGPNALVGIINLITKRPEDIGGINSSVSYGSSIGNEIRAFDKYNINVTVGKQLESGFGFLASINAILNNDNGLDYYDPDNIFKKGHVHYGELVSDNGFDNHQNDYIATFRLTKGENYTLGFDYSDIDEGLGSFLDGGNYMVNNNSVDCKWHTRRVSAFSSFTLDITDKIIVTPKLYFRKDQIVNNSGFAYNYDKPSYNAPRGTFRNFKQQCFRNGFDNTIQYQPTENLSLLGGIVLEETQTANEVSRYGFVTSNNHNIINPFEELYSEHYEYIYDEDGNVIDSVTVIDTLTYQNNQQFTFMQQYSLYYQAEYGLNESWKFLTGGRYYKETDLSGVFTPRVGVVYNRKDLFQDDDLLVFKLLYGEAFKALAHYDKYDGLTGELNDDLKPAKITTYEFSTGYLPNKYSRFEVTAWYNNIDNYYVYGTNCELDNINQITYGFQTSGEFKIRDFVVSANYTFTDGENRDQWYHSSSYSVSDPTDYEKLIRVSKHKINTSVTYFYNNLFHTSLKMKFIGDRNASPINLKYGKNEGFYLPYNYSGFVPEEDKITYNGTGIMPGYTIFDFIIGSSDLGEIRKSMEGFAISFEITNLFNTNYLETPRSESRVSPPYHPQPGRRFTLKLNYKLPLQ